VTFAPLPPPYPAFSCPRCGRVSHNGMDAAAGYCGACRDWTGTPTAVRPTDEFACPQCGDRFQVSPQMQEPVLCAACSTRRASVAMERVYEAETLPPRRPEGTYACAACGHRLEVPEFHAGRVWCPCGSPELMEPGGRYVPAAEGVPAVSRGLWQFIGDAEPGGFRFDAGMLARYIRNRALGTGIGTPAGLALALRREQLRWPDLSAVPESFITVGSQSSDPDSESASPSQAEEPPVTVEAWEMSGSDSMRWRPGDPVL
jgi:DNA-directed RNA polymerase subunit RPC12/RpoP